MKKDVLIAIIGKVTALASMMAIPGILAHAISQNDFGVYMLFAGSIPLGAVVIQFGLHQMIMRKLAEQLEINHRVWRLLVNGITKTIYMIGVMGLLCCLVTYVLQVDDLMQGLSKRNIILAIIWMALASLQLTIANIFQAFNRPAKVYLYGESGAALLSLIIIAVAGKLHLLGLTGALVILIATMAVMVIAGLKDIRDLAISHDRFASNSYNDNVELSSGMLVWVGYVITLGFYPLALWFLGVAGGASKAGELAIAYRVTTLIILPTMIINSLMPRRLMEYKLRQTVQKKQEIQQLGLYAVSAAFVGCIILNCYGDVIVRIWFGEGFITALVWIKIMQIARIIGVVSGAATIILAIYKKEIYFVISEVIALVMLIIILYMPTDIDVMKRVVYALTLGVSIQYLYQLICAVKVVGFFYPLRSRL